MCTVSVFLFVPDVQEEQDSRGGDRGDGEDAGGAGEANVFVVLILNTEQYFFLFY